METKTENKEVKNVADNTEKKQREQATGIYRENTGATAKPF